MTRGIRLLQIHLSLEWLSWHYRCASSNYKGAYATSRKKGIVGTSTSNDDVDFLDHDSLGELGF
jgi:hypothetical protein